MHLKLSIKQSVCVLCWNYYFWPHIPVVILPSFLYHFFASPLYFLLVKMPWHNLFILQMSFQWQAKSRASFFSYRISLSKWLLLKILFWTFYSKFFKSNKYSSWLLFSIWKLDNTQIDLQAKNDIKHKKRNVSVTRLIANFTIFVFTEKYPHFSVVQTGEFRKIFQVWIVLCNFNGVILATPFKFQWFKQSCNHPRNT